MDFINYCIKTRNYSVLKTIKDYSEIRTFTDKKKVAKIAAAVGLPATALAIGASDTKAGRKIREAVGMETLRDKYLKHGGEEIEDAYHDVDDNVGRKLRNSLGTNTLRDKALNLKDSTESTWDKIKDFFTGDDADVD